MFLGLDPLTWALVALGLIISGFIYARRIKRDDAPRWDPRPPNVRERIMAGVWLIAFLVGLANYYAGWQMLRGYDKWVVFGLLLGGLFMIERLPGTTHTTN